MARILKSDTSGSLLNFGMPVHEPEIFIKSHELLLSGIVIKHKLAYKLSFDFDFAGFLSEFL